MAACTYSIDRSAHLIRDPLSPDHHRGMVCRAWDKRMLVSLSPNDSSCSTTTTSTTAWHQHRRRERGGENWKQKIPMATVNLVYSGQGEPSSSSSLYYLIITLDQYTPQQSHHDSSGVCQGKCTYPTIITQLSTAVSRRSVRCPYTKYVFTKQKICRSRLQFYAAHAIHSHLRLTTTILSNKKIPLDIEIEKNNKREPCHA